MGTYLPSPEKNPYAIPQSIIKTKYKGSNGVGHSL